MLAHKKFGPKSDCVTFGTYIVFFTKSRHCYKTDGNPEQTAQSRITDFFSYDEAIHEYWSQEHNHGSREPYMAISRGPKTFKYLGEILSPNINGKAAIKEREKRGKQTLYYAKRATNRNLYNGRRSSETTIRQSSSYSSEKVATEGCLSIEKKKNKLIRISWNLKRQQQMSYHVSCDQSSNFTQRSNRYQL